MRTVYRSALGAALLIALAAPARAADPDAARDRRARVALALTGTPAGAPAPAPRAVVKDYAAGYKAAAESSRPLVVFVGCKEPHPAPGAVVARTDALGDVTGPAAVVGYPVGGTLFVHTVMACPVEDGALKTAIDGAAKKIDRPAPKPAGDKPAPKPLSWEIRAAAPPTCPDCETCPHCGKNLKDTPAKAVDAECWDRDGFPLRRTARGTYERVPGAAAVAAPDPPPISGHPLAPSCPNGRCPLPR
ncbi:hypothetical protein GobsT_12460 [Gemmata obscuriglobus]|uniref:hypothetical protein n=1 Tax=Gemmata obscuriglobus TaxID=114 RepID=UPI00016C562E|nr:hypothetical protein [Gemmata obscuriglobus]QEG26506.1 hypothetical protein GobsT_12460 [Gemmata obscuriglobus]VTS01806.1 unnamed protein product [Gemmata obscuriglobus UQM 2246]